MTRAKILKFNKIKRVNHWKKIRRANRAPLEGKYNIAERVSKFVGVAAKSSMKAQPRNPKRFAKDPDRTRYGGWQTYASGRRQGQQYYKSGIYSRPGMPPLYNPKNKGQVMTSLRSGMVWSIPVVNSKMKITLANIKYAKQQAAAGQQEIKNYTAGVIHRNDSGSYVRYVNGQKVRVRGVPIPELHEHGGTQKNKNLGHTSRNGVYIRHKTPGTTRYPARPYMAPAGKKGLADVKKKGYSRKVMKGIQPHKKYGIAA